MIETQVIHPSRILRAELSSGEEVVATLLAIAEEHELAWAGIWMRGELERARLVIGQRIWSRASTDPDRVSFADGRLAVCQGELRGVAQGRRLELHGTFGRQREVVVGELLEGVVGEGVTVTMIEGQSAANAR